MFHRYFSKEFCTHLAGVCGASVFADHLAGGGFQQMEVTSGAAGKRGTVLGCSAGAALGPVQKSTRPVCSLTPSADIPAGKPQPLVQEPGEPRRRPRGAPEPVLRPHLLQEAGPALQG